ncbi:bifunctional 2',3'-cyclic-nucleotide 2'-phosphodiesterase/3'-nucleotidase [Arenibaculum pallidiluteum]|uniref:bifunctional 2',3'-cyclic-nucleotide 2'-phosphodiesterase/3'-nucleotidase n=1 Tax=Arenibaculum pallidiluteum TaxID=2812559 RepID=UPI001F39C94D|nr:bifunctional 2',3'-cyclic-nucleotide 2'-phosphodiesterase/3'-nucleotidase [Arenibaculum pallidiluteum]
MSRTILLLAACLLGTTALAGTDAFAETVKLRVLGTTDLHVAALPYNYYADREDVTVGLSRTATLIEAARAEAKNIMLFDNGDTIQGNPLGDLVARERGLRDGEVHPIYRQMNLLGYEATTTGNHEYNYGLDFLARAHAGLRFPVVTANVVKEGSDEPYFDPYRIIEKKVVDETGRERVLKVGVLGLVTPQITTWDMANLKGKVRTLDIVDTARRYVPEMRAKGADLVIALAHTGLDPAPRKGGEENAGAYLAEIPGIDAILAGHLHKVFPGKDFDGLPGADMQKGTINGIPVVMPGFWGSHLGVIDLTLSDEGGSWKVVDGRAAARPIYELKDRQRVALVGDQPQVAEAARPEHEATLDYVRKPIGETSAPINSYFALVQDDPSIQIVTRAQAWYVEGMLKGSRYEGLPVLSAGAPFKAGGRSGAEYYTDIPSGRIAIKNAADLYLYPNTLRAVLVKGAGIAEWLEMSAGAFNRIDPARSGEQPLLNPAFPSYNFDVIDGVTYEIDVSQPARYDMDGKLANPDARRVRNLRFQGRPIDPAQDFVVVTNNYRAGGGGKFPGLDGTNIILEAPDENRTVLMNYIYDQKTLNPSSDGNWSLARTAGDAVVTFESSPRAAGVLPADGRISPAGEAANGFAKYRIDLRP